ncbi:MAG: TatD family deoxyribonuclease [Deltaproteobacteria bacterium]|nr:MAG: TatD family deoxyribonuclease [Deltaproteobacteria bacterium]
MLFDVHAHLTHPELRAREAELLARAGAAGVTSIVSNGLNPADNLAVLELARRAPQVRPALGLYPVDAILPEMVALGIDYPRDEAELLPGEEAVEWVVRHVDQAFAIGEIGLDGYWVPEELWGKQERHFRALVRLAIEADKAMILHTRKRERRALEILLEEGAKRVDWHCFGGKVKLARQIAEAGHWLSIPANVARSQSFQRMVETLPRDKILLETDCPYLGPERGELNEPANVAGTAAFIAQTWREPLPLVRERLAENYTALFGTPP